MKKAPHFKASQKYLTYLGTLPSHIISSGISTGRAQNAFIHKGITLTKKFREWGPYYVANEKGLVQWDQCLLWYILVWYQ